MELWTTNLIRILVERTAAHDGAVARDGGEGKGWGGAACKGAVVVACDGAGDPSMWVGSHWGRVGLGQGCVGEGEGGVRARRGLWVGGVSSWVCIGTSVGLLAQEQVARRERRQQAMETQHTWEKLTRPRCSVPLARQMVCARTSHIYINPQPRHPGWWGHPQ